MNKFYLLVFLLIVGVGESFSQNKIGIADTLFLLEELPSRDSTLEMIKAKKALNDEELRKMDSTFLNKREYYAAHKSEWSSLVLKNYENQMATLLTKIKQTRVERDEEIQRLNKDCDKRSSDILHQAMEKVSSDLQLKAVWDKSQALSSSDEIDITDKVHAEMLRIDHL